MSPKRSDVLVVGAGPTGLTLATDLARRGVAVRIVERSREHARGSRGKRLSPRSLEVLDDLGIVGRVLKAGVVHLPHRKYRGAEAVAETDPEAGVVPTPDTPYPVGLVVAQWRVEGILRERLADLGVAVELGAELRSFTQHDDGVTAIVGDESIETDYLIGCDGGRSGVRKALEVPFAGETSQIQLMAVGDVKVDGLSRDAWHQWFAPNGVILLCPLPGCDEFQVQASPELDDTDVPVTPSLEHFQRVFDEVAGVPGVRLHDLGWRSTYRVNVRMVDRLRVGRVLLAGDAAHVHPIAGGLGMNTGIQDAYNLGWKLHLVLAGCARERLLDTYEEERLPIASWLLDVTTERLDAVLSAVRTPGGGVDAGVTPALTQLGLRYPWSRLSGEVLDGLDDGLRAGDRAPDATCRESPGGHRVRLFDLFRGPHFTLLCLGGTQPPAVGWDLVRGYAVDDEDGHVRRACGWDRLVLVRPDGYVGLVAPLSDVEAVRAYLTSL